jgi:hypothetical protein
MVSHHHFWQILPDIIDHRFYSNKFHKPILFCQLPFLLPSQISDGVAPPNM